MGERDKQEPLLACSSLSLSRVVADYARCFFPFVLPVPPPEERREAPSSPLFCSLPRSLAFFFREASFFCRSSISLSLSFRACSLSPRCLQSPSRDWGARRERAGGKRAAFRPLVRKFFFFANTRPWFFSDVLLLFFFSLKIDSLPLFLRRAVTTLAATATTTTTAVAR